MSGIIGVSPDMRSGVVGVWPVGHVISTEMSSSYSSGWVEASSVHHTQTLSGYKAGNRCLITASGWFLEVLGNASQWFDLYLASADANSGIGQVSSGEKIWAEAGRNQTDWEIENYSYTFLTDPVSTTTPTYLVYAAENGTAKVSFNIRFTFQQIQG